MGGGISKVVPGIYVGGLAAAKSAQHLAKHNITHVCTVTNQPCEIPDKKQIIFTADDSPTENLARFFEDACFFIHEARVSGGSVLIHCSVGVSRSVTVTLAYLLVVTDFSLAELFKAIQGARHCACPNHGFMQQLIEFEATGAKELRAKLFARFGEWPADKRAADKSDLDQAIEIQEYYIQHGVYPGEKALEDTASNADDTVVTSHPQGAPVFRQEKPPINNLPPKLYTVYSHGRPRDLSEFLSSRRIPQDAQIEDNERSC